MISDLLHTPEEIRFSKELEANINSKLPYESQSNRILIYIAAVLTEQLIQLKANTLES